MSDVREWASGLRLHSTRRNIEQAIATLEKARYGLCFSSGLAAAAAVLLTIPPGSHIISLSDVYGGTREYFTTFAADQGREVVFTDNLEADLDRLIIPGKTKLVWLESPTNPSVKVTDIAKVAQIAHSKDVIVAVDNTFMSPYLQNPLEHGADIVVHSVTKFINGHSVSSQFCSHIMRKLLTSYVIGRGNGCVCFQLRSHIRARIYGAEADRSDSLSI